MEFDFLNCLMQIIFNVFLNISAKTFALFFLGLCSQRTCMFLRKQKGVNQILLSVFCYLEITSLQSANHKQN